MEFSFNVDFCAVCLGVLVQSHDTALPRVSSTCAVVFWWWFAPLGIPLPTTVVVLVSQTRPQVGTTREESLTPTVVSQHHLAALVKQPHGVLNIPSTTFSGSPCIVSVITLEGKLHDAPWQFFATAQFSLFAEIGGRGRRRAE